MRVYKIYTLWASVSLCFGTYEIYQIPNRQNKARKTLFFNMSSHLTSKIRRAEDYALGRSRKSLCAAKLLQIIDIRKYFGSFLVIFRDFLPNFVHIAFRVFYIGC
jgi:hypothetical protein